ncbi:MAG: hypothetical protein EZS28_025717, partial [Streblomastix strix]
MMVAEIQDAFRTGHPYEPCTFTKWVRDTYNKDISRGFGQSFRDRHWRDVKLCIAKPRKSTRFVATHEDVDRYKNELKDFVVGIDPNIVFHFDESGFQPQVDAHPQFILCPAETAPEQCVYKVKRSQKKYTVMPCFNFSEDSLRPLIIVNHLALDAYIFDFGLRLGIDFYISTSKKGYITKEIFVWWLQNVFLPCLDQIRPDNTKTAVFLMDNLRLHDTPEVQQLLHDANAKALFISKNSSHALQPLNLSTFHDLKSILCKTNSNFEEGTQAARI